MDISNRTPWSPPSANAFGAGRTERCIEVPWASRWLGDVGEQQILDIGFALSDLDWLAALLGKVEQGASVTAVDIITPERVATRYPEALRDQALRTPVIIGDVRTAPVPASSFDVVTCISTIEHVGFDAKGSTDKSAFARWSSVEETPDSRDPAVTRDVMGAFARALKPGGLALITVPMGKGGAVPVQDKLGYFTRQFEYDANSWREIVEAPGFRLLEQRFFTGLGDAGWREAESAADLAHQTAWLTPHATGLAIAALQTTSS